MRVDFITVDNVKVPAVNVKIKPLFVQVVQMLIHYVYFFYLLIILIDAEKGLCCYVANCI